MKNLGIVFKFELSNIINKKAFKVSTIILSVIILIGLTVPTIASLLGNPFFGEKDEYANEYENDNGKEENIKYGVMVENDGVDISILEANLPGIQVIEISSKQELEEEVLLGGVETGFVILSPTKYEYLVKNTSITDSNQYMFENALLNIYIEKTIVDKGMDYNEVAEVYNTHIDSEMEILGKDGVNNYFYTYILLFGLYFIILFYGQMIATSVASEKSNRSMEILVTSTSTESLIFGKVLAGALAGIMQFATIILVAFFAYKLNINAWDNTLDFLFDIPTNVLLTFSVFGVLGYLLSLFIYGTVGALVSRTEDINASSSPIILLLVAAFFISMIGLNSPDMLILKIASFFPLTSFMAMFVRISMGSVSTIQVAISLILLLFTTIAIGIFGSKIYRLGTLMYGNPIKLSRAFKMLRNQ